MKNSATSSTRSFPPPPADVFLGVWELANWILSMDAAEEGGFMRLSSKMEGLVDRLMQRMTMALLAQVLRTIYTRMGISNAQQRSLIRRLQVSISRLEHPPQQPHSDPGTQGQLDTFPSWCYNSASQETRTQEPRRDRVPTCQSESTTLSVCTLLAPQSLYEFSFYVHQDAEHGRESFTMLSFFQVAQTSGTRAPSDFSHSCGHSGRSGSSCRTLKSRVFLRPEMQLPCRGGAVCGQRIPGLFSLHGVQNFKSRPVTTGKPGLPPTPKGQLMTMPPDTW